MEDSTRLVGTEITGLDDLVGTVAADAADRLVLQEHPEISGPALAVALEACRVAGLVGYAMAHTAVPLSTCDEWQNRAIVAAGLAGSRRRA